MCGIVGIAHFDRARDEVSEHLLSRMRDTMAHRGPDAKGLWLSPEKHVGLGHRRLAIVDLSTAADQPMRSSDGRIVLSYNGEIYNHAEIRSELEAAGVGPWKTDHSDTEVVIHAYRKWGRDCLDRFRGMFAFALWDSNARELWLVRDRVGIKPLYFSVGSDKISFASEIKALLEDPSQRREVDEEALYHYLSFLTVPAPRTMFAGIKKLPGGTWLRVTLDGTVEERRWWDPLESAEPMPGISETEAAELVADELRRAVALRKVSDVPVGVFLSGGIDSSTNAALFSQTHAESHEEMPPVKTFSIGYAGENKSYPNELRWARKVAEFVGSEHHERILDVGDLLDFVPRMVRLQDEPIADPVCVPIFYLSELARSNGVIVCQVGEGADELFWGYPQWKTALTLERRGAWPVPRFAKRLALAGLGAMGRDSGFRYEWLRRNAEGLPVFWGGAEAFPEASKTRLISPSMRKDLDGLTSWDAIQPLRARFERLAWEPSTLAWMTYLDLNLRLPELLLMRVDKMSMGASLEARVPFLDHKIVELAMGLPESAKAGSGELKAVLKRAVRGVIPDDVIDRPKQGFGVPIDEWFDRELGVYARRELEAFCADADFLDLDAVRLVLDRAPSSQAWFLLNLALWWREYIAREPIDLPARGGALDGGR